MKYSYLKMKDQAIPINYNVIFGFSEAFKTRESVNLKIFGKQSNATGFRVNYRLYFISLLYNVFKF